MAHELVQIIEDEPEQAWLLEHAFQKAGYRTKITFDGITGLDVVRRLKPALVILDIMLPELDGYGLCRFLRKDPATRHIPIIMVTALTDNIHQVLPQALGADDLVMKPFRLAEIIERGTHLIQQKRGRKFVAPVLA